MAVTWESVEIGDALPELRKRPDLTQLVKFAAGNGDFNPLHHDYNFIMCKHIGSVLVQGHFRYAALGELVTQWLGHNAEGRVLAVACQHRGMDFPGTEIVCKGTVEKKYEENGEKRIDLTIWTENSEGQTTSPGTSTVVFS